MRMRWIDRVATLLLLAAAVRLGGCPVDPRTNDKQHAVARIGTVTLKDDQLLAALAQRGTSPITDPAARTSVAHTVLERMIEDELLLAGAANAGIQVSDEELERELRHRSEGYPPGLFPRVLGAEQLTIEQFKERVRRRLVEDAFLRARLSQLPAPTEDAVRARYDATIGQETRPAAVRARQVLLKTGEEAAHVLGLIRARTLAFEDAATRYSTAPEADSGGDLGWFSEGEMPVVFDVCFLLAKGQVSEVVASDYGFHIFQVIDTRPARVEPFEAARARVEDELARERQSAATAKLLEDLKATISVTVSEDVVARVLAIVPFDAPLPPGPRREQDDVGSRALDAHAVSNPLPEVPHPEREKKPAKPAAVPEVGEP